MDAAYNLKRSLLLFFSRIIYSIARSFYKLLKVFLKPLMNSHPRVHRFGVSVRDAFKELIRPADSDHTTAPAVLLDVMHEVISEDRKKNEIPEWLIAEWKEMHEIEPQLFPETWLVNTVPYYRVPDSRVGAHYLELCTLYGEGVSHVFLVPWLKRGGADLVTINYVNALVQEKNSDGIVLIATLDADSPWTERLPEGVRFIEFGKTYSHLSPDEQETLLTRVLIQKAPKVIHTINSDLAYRVLVKHGKALSGTSDLYACSFCEDITPEGKYVGYPFMYLPRCFEHLKAVFSDNKTFVAKLHDIYAFDTGKMHVHYQPVAPPARRASEIVRTAGQRLEILWAGRLDRQKRPDILIGIAEKCRELPFTFHVYGSPVIDTNIYAEAFNKLGNIRYSGAFNGLPSLKTEEYDLFLYTSQWDGLPNVLLEAFSLGLPVVASDVGGISELITDRETGYLIAPYDDVERYVDCLQEIVNHKERLPSIADNARNLIARRHSWKSFTEDLRNLPGYLRG
jgi:glycosyltransferase involved in cell wall biosynthesis